MSCCTAMFCNLSRMQFYFAICSFAYLWKVSNFKLICVNLNTVRAYHHPFMFNDLTNICGAKLLISSFPWNAPERFRRQSAYGNRSELGLKCSQRCVLRARAREHFQTRVYMETGQFGPVRTNVFCYQIIIVLNIIFILHCTAIWPSAILRIVPH